MKHGLLLAFLLAGCGSFKAEPGVLRPPGLAGPWIGLSADGLTWYRLELDEEGTGACATAGKEAALFRARRWSVTDEGALTVSLEMVEGPPDAARILVLHGRYEPARLELVAQERHSLTLWRENDLLAAREKMARRMEGPRG
jgi:hypothetical protein